MTIGFDLHLILSEQLRAFFVSTVFTAVRALPMLGCTVCRACRRLVKVVNPFMTDCVRDCVLAGQQHFAFLICIAFAAALANPVLTDTVFRTGFLDRILMNQIMIERRNHNFRICHRLCTLVICIASAAEAAFPVFIHTGFLAGCCNRCVLLK